MLRSLILATFVMATPVLAQPKDNAAKDVAVNVINRSEPELCAEKDNVWLDFKSPDVKQFRVQAIHPAFIGGIVVDKWAPDFTSCDMSRDPIFVANARRVTFYESPDFWLTGYTYPSFWRPNTVPFRVGDRVEQGLHVVQLWVKHQERAEEVLVVYPPDGYWRARPLPPARLEQVAYGTSFLVGPVDHNERPYVALKDIRYDPAERRFTLNFERGGTGTLSVNEPTEQGTKIDVTLSQTVRGKPFLTFRSMYVTESNADSARVEWKTKAARGWREAPVMTFSGAEATMLRLGRVVPSRHNTSAPDMLAGPFQK